MKHRPRSPFRGMARSEITALRLLIMAQKDWKRRLGTPEQAARPVIPVEVYSDLGWNVRLRAEDKLVAWWRSQPDYEATYAVYLDQFEKLVRPDRWEARQLRYEVTQLRVVVESIQQHLTKAEPTWES